MKNGKAAVAAVYTAMGIVLFAVMNFMFTPGYVWFYYPAFAALWVPLALFFFPRRGPVGFALVGSALTIAFLAAVNLQNSPDHLWFLYAVLPLVWWPIGGHYSMRKKNKSLSVVGSMQTIAWIIVINCIESPMHPWFLYACYPVLWWPIVMFTGKRAGTLAFSVLCSTVTICYYAALNVFVSPGFPWVLFPAFAILWWPMSMYFAKIQNWLGFSFSGTLLASVFFIAVNMITSPGFPWAMFPIFVLLWWPLTMLCAKRKSWLGYSVAGALLASAFFLAVNLITSHEFLWSVFPIFAVLWWPLSVYYFNYRKRLLAQ